MNIGVSGGLACWLEEKGAVRLGLPIGEKAEAKHRHAIPSPRNDETWRVSRFQSAARKLRVSPGDGASYATGDTSRPYFRLARRIENMRTSGFNRFANAVTLSR